MRIYFYVLAGVLMPAAAQAYVGPGAGMGTVAVILAIILGFFLLLVGFLWYPIKRLIKGRNPAPKIDASTSAKD